MVVWASVSVLTSNGLQVFFFFLGLSKEHIWLANSVFCFWQDGELYVLNTEFVLDDGAGWWYNIAVKDFTCTFGIFSLFFSLDVSLCIFPYFFFFVVALTLHFPDFVLDRHTLVLFSSAYCLFLVLWGHFLIFLLPCTYLLGTLFMLLSSNHQHYFPKSIF